MKLIAQENAITTTAWRRRSDIRVPLQRSTSWIRKLVRQFECDLAIYNSIQISTAFHVPAFAQIKRFCAAGLAPTCESKQARSNSTPSRQSCPARERRCPRRPKDFHLLPTG